MRSDGITAVYLQKKKDAKRVYCTAVHAKTNSDGHNQKVHVYTNFTQTICTCPVQTAHTLVCPTLFVYMRIYVRAQIRRRRVITPHTYSLSL